MTGTVQIMIASTGAADSKSGPKTIPRMGAAASESPSAPPIVTQATTRKELRISATNAMWSSAATRAAVA